MLGIHAWCEKCGNEIALDYLSPLVGWFGVVRVTRGEATVELLTE